MRAMKTSVAVTPTEERERAISTIESAFINDSVARWVYPDAQQYLTYMPAIVEAFGGRAFEHGSAYAAPDVHAAALWLPPGVEPDNETMGQIMDESVAPERMNDLSGFVEKQSANHPDEAHWYLPLIGVDPVYQGRGLGGALLSYATSIADEDRMPCYLEASNLDNRRLYERHGFVAVNETQHGSSPTIYGMWREPR